MLYITNLFLTVVNYIVSFIYNVIGLLLGRGWRLADEYLDTSRIEVIRPDDLLVLTFDFTGLQIKKSGKELWLVASSGGDGYLSVIFPPQSVGERAFLESDDNFPLVDETGAVLPGLWDKKERPVAARLSGESRLTFVVPADSAPIPYTLEGLLKACRQLKMSLSPIASGKKSEITNPAFEPEPVTAIEAPYRLILSPNNWARWQHALAPVTSVASTEHRRRDFGVVGRFHVTFGDLLLPGNQLRSFESADTPETEYTELWHTQLVLDTPGQRRESGSTQQHFERQTNDKAESIVFQADTELRLRAIWSRTPQSRVPLPFLKRSRMIRPQRSVSARSSRATWMAARRPAILPASCLTLASTSSMSLASLSTNYGSSLSQGRSLTWLLKELPSSSKGRSNSSTSCKRSFLPTALAIRLTWT